jgi:hypothetical protein
MFSNPTQTSGTFYDAFHSKREFWTTIHVSSEEAAAVDPPIEGLALQSYIDEKRAEWGVDSPLYAVRIRGDFADHSENSVVAISDIEAAVERWEETQEPTDALLHIGVDVARFGDDESVIQPRRGNKALPQRLFNGLDNVDLAGEVLRCVREMRRVGERPVVKVDVIGNGGGVADHLRRYPKELELVEVNVAEAASVEGFPKLRDQLWFGLSKWLSEGGSVPPDPKLEGELAAPHYSFDLQGRQKVEGKDDIKKRLGRSPDRADALALSVYPARAPLKYRPSADRGDRGTAW